MQQTADVDANQTLAGTPVSGSFSCFCAVADVAMDGATVTDAAMTAVCGSFSCSSAAVDSAITDADADLTAHYDKTGRASAARPVSFYLSFCALEIPG